MTAAATRVGRIDASIPVAYGEGRLAAALSKSGSLRCLLVLVPVPVPVAVVAAHAAEIHAPDPLRMRGDVENAWARAAGAGRSPRGRLQLEVHGLVPRHALRDVPARSVVVSAEDAEVGRRVQRLRRVVADDVGHRQVAVVGGRRELTRGAFDPEVPERARP